MRNKLIAYTAFSTLFMVDTFQIKNKEWKKRLHKEWRESMKLPRKKKKAIRKRILSEWSIACWEPSF